jgi:hypothetical protein
MVDILGKSGGKKICFAVVGTADGDTHLILRDLPPIHLILLSGN